AARSSRDRALILAADVADRTARAAAADGSGRAQLHLRIAWRLLAGAVAAVGRGALAAVTAHPAVERIVLKVHAAAATTVASGRAGDRANARAARAGGAARPRRAAASCGAAAAVAASSGARSPAEPSAA